uniref:Recombinase n=1 Tax=Escherichia phage ETEP102 TaxID=3117680 RepID=A0AAU6PXK7_9CAUD
MRTSEKFSTVSSALIAAKKQFAIAKKSGYNTHLKSHYSNLTDVLEAIEPALKEHDLMVIQSNLDTSTEKVMHIETLILHSSGEWLSFQYNMPIEKISAQAYGSTTSYGRRYALCAALGITQSDDDAEIAKRTAADYKKLITNCEKLEDLQVIYKSAKGSLGAAEWKIAEDHLQKRKAELSIGNARGFQPAKKADPQKVDDKVANAPSEPVQSESIEKF